jgi:endonuclease/exonuclease/phosphatase family metal-dependent hydrolase
LDTWPFLWQREVSEAALDPGIEIMLWNAWRRNDNWTEIENYIRHTDGDIVILQETGESVRSKLRNLDDLYVPVMHHDNVVLLSHSLRNASAKPYPLASGHAVEIRLDFDGNDFAILTTHLPTPTSSSNVSNRRLQIAALRAWASQQRSEHLLIGDFNMTPWSFEYRELIEDTGLNDSMIGFGIQTSWPFHDFLTSLFRIPLDHCLTSTGLAVGKRTTAEPGSSNHRPLHVRIHLAVRTEV